MHLVFDKQLRTEFDQRAIKGTLSWRGLALHPTELHTTGVLKAGGLNSRWVLLSSCCHAAAAAAERREKGPHGQFLGRLAGSPSHLAKQCCAHARHSREQDSDGHCHKRKFDMPVLTAQPPS